MNETSIQLRGLGRLSEALDPLRVAGEIYVTNKRWDQAAISYNNLSQLELTLGKVRESVEDAKKAVSYADRGGVEFSRILIRTTYADTLHQAGHRKEARRHFFEAEQMQLKVQPTYPHLYSEQGFRYSDLLLCGDERAAWNGTLTYGRKLLHSKALDAVAERATQSLEWARESPSGTPLDVALNKLILGRTALYRAVLTCALPLKTNGLTLTNTLDDAVNGLRRASAQEFILYGLLARAWLRFLIVRADLESAHEDLREAGEIAERGPMRLFMADIHLYRARLFFREAEYPWESARKDLEEAERLINECGYHRRDEELADAKRVILNQSA